MMEENKSDWRYCPYGEYCPNYQKVKIDRYWCMPNHRTFEMEPVRLLRKEYFEFENHIDPFPFESRIDCFDYFSQFEDNSMDEGDLDPPYTKRQVSEHYKKNGGKVTGWHTSSGWSAKVKDEMARILKPNSVVISYGYNTAGLGKKRGFEQIHIRMLCHGGDHYDTLCTVERKIQERLT